MELDELKKEIKKWLDDYDKTRNPKLAIDDDYETFEGSAYQLLSSALSELTK